MTKHEKNKRHYEEKSDEDEENDRAAKKASKKAAKVAKLLGYTNDLNPFGDSNLLQPFKWGKKVEKDKREGKSEDDRGGEDRRVDLLNEIGRVRKRREDREKEVEEMERLRGEEQRLREAASYGDWQEKEEEFHTEQIKTRSAVRISEQREQLIDTIAKNLLILEVVEETLPISSSSSLKRNPHTTERNPIQLKNVRAESSSPVELLLDMTAPEVERLLPEIEAFLQLAQKHKDTHLRFWENVHTIAVSIKRKHKMRLTGESIHRSLMDDVEGLIQGKSNAELDRLQQDIEKNLREGRSADRAYWEEVSQQISLARAKEHVTHTHNEVLAIIRPALREARHGPADSAESKHIGDDEDGDVDGRNEREVGIRQALMDGGMDERAISSSAELGKDEEKMGQTDELALPTRTYAWQDKHRPRKPRYFNRVRTGFDWNKYNSTHYDKENPPPKTIQGYKFAVFYPDLIDNTVTPKFFVEASDHKDFAIIRFHAGPPYEDIAFRIVNKQWDKDRRAGFRSVFERGVLTLNFNFMRQWYRR